MVIGQLVTGAHSPHQQLQVTHQQFPVLLQNL